MEKTNKFDYFAATLIAIFFFALLVVGQLVPYVLIVNLLGFAEDSLMLNVFSALFAALITFVMFILSNLYFEKKGLAKIDVLKCNKRTLNVFLTSTFIIFSIIISTSLFFSITTDDTFLDIFTGVLLIKVIYQFSPALMEEFLFRGFLLNFFKQKNKKYLGLNFTGSIFGFIHLINYFVGNPVSFLELLNITSAGFFLGLLYLNFGLFSSVVVHYFWNVFAVRFEGEIFPTVLIIAACVILYFKLEKKLFFKIT